VVVVPDKDEVPLVGKGIMENVVESGGQPVGWMWLVPFVLVAFDDESGADGEAVTGQAVAPLSG
jgi:hypothetical protein